MKSLSIQIAGGVVDRFLVEIIGTTTKVVHLFLSFRLGEWPNLLLSVSSHVIYLDRFVVVILSTPAMFGGKF